ncbi:MAG: hypothetical protein NWF08_05255 [Candidatus Bathyarchaeota archaeon]|nr:hypothetical protein [Candidatus Bathyarchaeota archaeon]
MVIEWVIAGGIIAASALVGAGIGHHYASKHEPYYVYPSYGYYRPAYYFTPRPVYYYSPCW